MEKAGKVLGTDSLSECEKSSTSIFLRLSQSIFLGLCCERETLSGCGDLRLWHQQVIQEVKALPCWAQSDQGCTSLLGVGTALPPL